MNKSNIETYAEARVVMSPNAELILALPIYANQNGAIFDEKMMNQIVGMDVSVGFYKKLGYLCYNPASEFAWYMSSINLFVDLGSL